MLPQSYQYPNLSEGADRVDGQLRGDKECLFSGVTKSGRVWKKVPESDARSVVIDHNVLSTAQGHLRERERETERERDRQRDRQRLTETDRDKDKQRQRQRQTETERRRSNERTNGLLN